MQPRFRSRARVTLGAIGCALCAALGPPTAAAEAASGWPPLQIVGRSVEPGETLRTFIPLVRTLAGESRTLDTLVVVTRGTRSGPTLCLTAGIHGDELNGMEVAHRIYAKTPGASLAGTLIAVPAVNMQGVRSGNRYLPDRRDLNRAFPGSADGSLAARIAHSLFQGIVRYCDALIDLHTGSANRANLPQIRTDLKDARAVDLARSFGVGVVLNGRGPRGSLRRELLDAGVPAVIYEAGAPLRFEEVEIARGVEGVERVMAHLGMLEAKTEHRPSIVYRRTTWVRSPDAAGIFLASRRLGDDVREGDELGSVIDPVSEARAAVGAPEDGRIIGMAVPQLVLPGYGLFQLGFDPE